LSKFHRHNHHTYGRPGVEPDAGYDPISSSSDTFNGELVLQGSLSCVAPLSAYAGYFESQNTAICAIGGTIGLFVSAPSHDLGNINISTFGSTVTFPVITQPAIRADGSIVTNACLSAEAIWTTTLYALSSVINVLDMETTEVSGFQVKGVDFGLFVSSANKRVKRYKHL